ncbi:hypothetical protein [Methyloceanibacter sp.]|uniref:hypothetical protein n=1 Tax=Methyloceanibacter sp. TaxID=1965321 RepID=UPI002B80C597|nr:hypothetical protein [Methyloceanibacter sp.]HML93412.1 hypothetical protein [Methyloceanibacter sp.]
MRNKQHSEMIAQHINSYWHERGDTGVRAYVEAVTATVKGSNRQLYVVRSNLVNGLPPKAPVEHKEAA